MDSYLDLAARVLREVRKPLGARQILQTAYQMRIVPQNLYGKTQHKTLQARLAESIRRERTRSPFLRTDPGRFFLRSFLGDPSIPTRYKREYPARPRADQLRSFEVACFRRSDAGDIPSKSILDPNALTTFPVAVRRLAEVSSDDQYLFLRIFVVTAQPSQIMVRRAAHSLRDALGSKISLGSLGFVRGDDRSMFSEDPFGLTEASLRTMSEQLNLTSADINRIRERRFLRLIGFLAAPPDARENSLAAIAVCSCPGDFDPISRYAGGGAIYWHPTEARFNDIEVLDPWSRELLELDLFEGRI